MIKAGGPEPYGGAGTRTGHQITGWVSRTARLRAPATAGYEERRSLKGGGNSSAELAVSSGAS